MLDEALGARECLARLLVWEAEEGRILDGGVKRIELAFTGMLRFFGCLEMQAFDRGGSVPKRWRRLMGSSDAQTYQQDV